MKPKRLVYLTIMGLACVLVAGCSTTLDHGKLYGKAMQPKGPMGVNARAENMKKNVGWGTFTIFAIPVAPVTVNGVPDEELMNQIKDAVEQCGYQVKLVENPPDAAGLPVLSCHVQKFKFRNYTWLFPIVFNWGTIALDVSVKDPDGQVVWSKSYKAKANGLYDFNYTVNKALTTLLNEMVSDLMNSDFKSKAGA